MMDDKHIRGCWRTWRTIRYSFAISVLFESANVNVLAEPRIVNTGGDSSSKKYRGFPQISGIAHVLLGIMEQKYRGPCLLY